MSPRHTTLPWVEDDIAGASRRTIVEPGEIGRTRFVVVPRAIDHDLPVLDGADGLLRLRVAPLQDDTTLLPQRGAGGQER